jgi:hypothetical protein
MGGINMRSRLKVSIVASALLLVVLPAVEGKAVSPPPPSTVQQQWELLAAPESGVSSTKTVTILRGSIGGNAMSPAPTISLDAVGRVQGATGAATWTIELRSATAVLGTVQFGVADTAFTLRSSTTPISWPATATDLVSLRLVPAANGANLTGSFSLNKASLRLTQTGTIMATKGRFPLAPTQGINSTTYVDVADAIHYRHSTQGFNPAPTVRLRVTAQTTTYPVYANVRLVNSAGTSVGGLEFWGTGGPASMISQPLTLQSGQTYRLQAQSAQPNWQLYSADLEFTQSTVDPAGLTSLVGWYPTVAIPLTLATNQRVEQMIKPTQNDVELTNVEWITVLKRLAGSGSVGADLVAAGGTDPLVSGVTTTSTSFAVTIRSAPPLPLDTITSLVSSKTAFSPAQDPPYGVTDISGAIHPDAQSPTWHLSIVDEANEEVAHATGTGNNPAFTWDGADPTTSIIYPDGTYTANLTIENFPRVLRQVTVVADSSGPLIGRLSIFPRDHGNTHFSSQPLLARITDATAGVDPASIDFTLIDETDPAARVETTHTATSYDPVTGWAKTAPVSLQANHLYRIAVHAVDLVGNYAAKSQRPVRDGGGFLAITATPSATSASIPSTPCSVSSVDPATQTRHVTCSSVPLVLQATTLQLSSVRRGAYGFVDHRVSLSTAVLQSTVLGQPVSQAAYPVGTTRTEALPFTVENPSWTSQAKRPSWANSQPTFPAPGARACR